MSDTESAAPLTVGVLGAGRAGTALARALARIPTLTPGASAPVVRLASTAPPRRLRHHLTIYAPLAEAVSAEQLAAQAEVSVLAVPRDALDDVDPAALRGPRTRTVVDMTNMWDASGVDAAAQPTTAEVDSWLSTGTELPVVRAFFDISHHDLAAAGRVRAPRRALAVGSAADEVRARREIANLVRTMGYDAVEFAGSAAGAVLEPGGAAFGTEHDAESLERLLHGR